MSPKKKRRRVIAPRLEDFVEKLLAAMMSYGEVVDHGMAKFDCDERTVTRAIAAVRARWRESEASTVEERRTRFRAELEHAWKCALAAGDYRAIAVMSKTRLDLEGLKQTKKVEHSGTVGLRPVAAMSPQDREREIALLLAKRQAALGDGTPAPPELSPEPIEDTEIVPPRSSKPGRKKRTQVH